MSSSASCFSSLVNSYRCLSRGDAIVCERKEIRNINNNVLHNKMRGKENKVVLHTRHCMKPNRKFYWFLFVFINSTNVLEFEEGKRKEETGRREGRKRGESEVIILVNELVGSLDHLLHKGHVLRGQHLRSIHLFNEINNLINQSFYQSIMMKYNFYKEIKRMKDE